MCARRIRRRYNVSMLNQNWRSTHVLSEWSNSIFISTHNGNVRRLPKEMRWWLGGKRRSGGKGNSRNTKSKINATWEYGCSLRWKSTIVWPFVCCGNWCSMWPEWPGFYGVVASFYRWHIHTHHPIHISNGTAINTNSWMTFFDRFCVCPTHYDCRSVEQSHQLYRRRQINQNSIVYSLFTHHSQCVVPLLSVYL